MHWSMDRFGSENGVRKRIFTIVSLAALVSSFAMVAAAAQATAPSAIVYADCLEMVAAFDVPGALLTPHLPEGFHLLYSGEPSPMDLVGALVVYNLTCQVDGATTNELLGLVEVVPPDELAGPNADFHQFLLWGFAADDAAAGRWASWCFAAMQRSDVHDVDVTQLPSGRVGHVLASTAASSVDYTNAAVAPTEAAIGLINGAARVFGESPEGDIVWVDQTWADGVAHGGSAAIELNGVAPIDGPLIAPLSIHIDGGSFTYTFTGGASC